MNGLVLLLLFALGPTEKGVCGNPFFVEEVKKFLSGDDSKEEDIKRTIPAQMRLAWSQLQKISAGNKKEPLSLETVSEYVFGGHNRVALPDCAVKAGVIEKIDRERGVLLVVTPEGKKESIKFYDFQRGSIGLGDKIAFHHCWLIVKITEDQFNALRK